MQTKIFVVWLAVASCLALSCQPGTSDKNISENNASKEVAIPSVTSDSYALNILRNVLNKSPKDSLLGKSELGREVSLDSAMQCVKLYETEMPKHGITPRDPFDSTICVNRTKKITISEEFGGPQLIEWLVKEVRELDTNGTGEDISIELRIGIYTDEFLATYLKGEPDLQKQKKGRTTIFLVAVDKSKSALKDGSTAYELGGVAP